MLMLRLPLSGFLLLLARSCMLLALSGALAAPPPGQAGGFDEDLDLPLPERDAQTADGSEDSGDDGGGVWARYVVVRRLRLTESGASEIPIRRGAVIAIQRSAESVRVRSGRDGEPFDLADVVGAVGVSSQGALELAAPAVRAFRRNPDGSWFVLTLSGDSAAFVEQGVSSRVVIVTFARLAGGPGGGYDETEPEEMRPEVATMH